MNSGSRGEYRTVEADMNSVLYWNAVLLEVSRRDFTRGFVNSQNPGPIGTSRAMAMVHLAIRDALALPVSPAKAYLPPAATAGIAFPGLPAAGPARDAYLDDVVTGAASELLRRLYPGSREYIEGSETFSNAAAYAAGQAIAVAMEMHRATDGAFKDAANADVPIAGAQPRNPVYGDHRADPYDVGQARLGIRWGGVTHFAGTRVALDAYPGAAQQAGEDYLTNAHYTADYDEVRDLGKAGSAGRTPEQRVIGVYWGYDGANNLGVPPRLYNQIVRKFVRDKAAGLSREQCADLFAIVNCAMADAGIDSWHWKYQFNLWRPVVGIRNEVVPTERDPFWAPLGAPQTNSASGTRTPNFPAYPSGHATFGAAMYQALRLYFKTAAGPIKVADVLKFDNPNPPGPVPKEEISFVSDELDGRSVDSDGSIRTRLDRHLGSFAQAVWENSVSRVYLGVHWRFDGLPQRNKPNQNIGGVPLGLEIGINAFDAFKNRLLAPPPP